MRHLLMTMATILLAAGSCAHSCGPDFDRPGPDGPAPPAYASCVGIQEGARCTARFATTCEERKQANVACNKLWRCSTLGDSHWEALAPEKTGCSDGCPANVTEQNADGCSAPNAATLRCEYAEGTCGCAKSDAGTFEWRCVKPAEGCPALRPALGAECLDVITCDYGASVFENGARLRCHYETWQSD